MLTDSQLRVICLTVLLSMAGHVRPDEPGAASKPAQDQFSTSNSTPSLTTELQARLDEAKRLTRKVVGLYGQGKFADAIEFAQQAQAITKEVLGEQHSEYATSLNNLASLYRSVGDFARAEALHVEARAIRKKTLGERHPDYLSSLNNLAALYFSMADYARAEPLFVEAGATYKEIFGQSHPIYATSLNNLALLYDAIGDYARAEPLCIEALAIQKEVLGARHPGYATTLNNLALIYKHMGDYARAEPLYVEARAIWKEALGEKHPDYATSLNNLAKLYESMADYARAEPLYVEARAIYKEALGERHPDYALTLSNLALLYWRMEDYENSESLHIEARTITRDVLGGRHPDYATKLNNLALLYASMGNYTQAEPLYIESGAIKSEVLGGRHPDYAAHLNNLALLYCSMRDYARAEPLFREAVDVLLENWELAAVVQSERQQRAMGEGLRVYLDNYLSLALARRENPTSVYAAVLRWKGAVLARQRAGRLLRSIGDPEVRTLADELRTTAGRIAASALATPAPAQLAAWRKQLDELSAEKERLEAQLSAASAKYRNSRAEQRLAPSDLERALPEDAALIDMLEYWHSTPSAEKKGPQNFERRLAAFVVRRGIPVVLVDLGLAEEIAECIESWRAVVERQGDPTAIGIELRELLWEPLVAHLGSATTVFISPDGALTRFPLAALPGSKPGTYLLEDVALVVVPVAQLLPGMLGTTETPVADASGSPAPSLLVVGDVDFDAADAAPQPASELFATTHRSAARSGETTFTPLPGAAREAEAIQQRFRQSFADGNSRLLRQAEASEAEFREASPKYRYLHLATHGYFAPPTIRSAMASDKPPTGFEARLGGAQEVAGFNPGLLSGLALAGANRSPEPGRDDGILTALEAAELNLDGVELVTLSACETGLGATAGGEGVLGLQRAFQAAGAGNVVSSLWKVDDQATAALMALFYENLWQKKQPAVEALRNAQLTILNNPDQIEAYATRGVGGIRPLPDGGKVAASTTTTTSKRTDVRRWAAFQLSGAGR